ncbi:amino acid dehydrogenase [Rhodoferax lacus]|uniref:Amino acid dehydrogenase n=1 Tax=Rhodoferax lacus TaxID=2184758 RepID=A0A3E1RET1_9BURK|nr:FAD-binding oxidoreductase [Rhodoferax lacus]RFO97879.1 amino acid dehydrogenase [Rhodoferax lacus]
MANVAVIGAGFVGLSSAWWLVRDGHQVTLYDPAGAAGGASFGNAGTFANYACIPVNNPTVFRDLPHYLLSGDSPLRLRWGYLPQLMPWLLGFLRSSTTARYTRSATALAMLLGRAQQGYAEMLTLSSLQGFVRPRECLYLYSSVSTFEASLPTLELRRSLGVKTRILDQEAVQALEPSLQPLFARGALFEGSWHLSDPSAFLQALQSWLVAQGMQVRATAAQALQPQAEGVVLQTAEGSARHDYVAVCAGAHSKALAAQCGDHVPLEAERGYHLMFPGASHLVSRPVGWAERGFYMTPMAEGLRVAGTVELAGMGPQKHQGLLDLLRFSSQRALPQLGQPVAPWLGFRPTLPDGLPVLGRSSASARVVYAFGHQHIGLTLGGLSGMVVADQVAGRACDLDLKPFSATRF